jgi:GNAT superfamily N-acetyltransferase
MEAGYRVTTDPDEIDHDAVWRWLRDESYWAAGRSWDRHERIVAGSRCIAILDRDGATVAFARTVTDGETFAWVADVLVLPEHRGQGLGTALMAAVVETLPGVKRLLLATKDAHGLYAHSGFGPLHEPERFMERRI